jgi:hypothetical protein
MSRTIVEKLQKLLPTEVTGIANILEGKNAVADKNLKEHLPLIKYEAEILLLPDVQAMNLAIKAHVNEHRQKERNAKRNVITSINISQLLSQLSLRKIRVNSLVSRY